jgi:hypothetical protein
LALVLLGSKEHSESVALLDSVHARLDGACAVAEEVTGADHLGETLGIDFGHMATTLAVACVCADVRVLNLAVVAANQAGNFTGTVLRARLDEATKGPGEVLSIRIRALEKAKVELILVLAGKTSSSVPDEDGVHELGGNRKGHGGRSTMVVTIHVLDMAPIFTDALVCLLKETLNVHLLATTNHGLEDVGHELKGLNVCRGMSKVATSELAVRVLGVDAVKHVGAAHSSALLGNRSGHRIGSTGRS